MEYKFAEIKTSVENIGDLTVPEPKDRVIEKRGHVITFTLNEVEANTKDLLQKKKEIEAKKGIEDAKMENISSFHTFVTEMSEEDLFTAWMYQEAKGMSKMCQDKLDQINTQLENDAKEVAEIKKQLPILEEVVSPLSEEVIQEHNEKGTE
jgi:adenylosuccinate synthase